MLAAPPVAGDPATVRQANRAALTGSSEDYRQYTLPRSSPPVARSGVAHDAANPNSPHPVMQRHTTAAVPDPM
jgi:hypothetical protein